MTTKIKALHACNGGGQKMKPGKIYDVPDKDARYLVASKKAELVKDKEAEKESEKVDEKEDGKKDGKSKGLSTTSMKGK